LAARREIVAVAAVLLVASGASAQYRIDAWTTETGLPQNSVTSLLQTRDGYLWMGTTGGLVRFDGVTFTVQATGAPGGLQSVRISSLLEDGEGGLWIGTEHGGLVRYRGGSFHAFTTADGLPTNGVSFIARDHQHRLWLATVDGLVRFENGRFTTYTMADGLPADPVTQIVSDRDGHVWFGTSRGLVKYAGGRFTIVTTRDGLPDDSVQTLLAGRDGSLWAGTSESGLARIRDGRVTRFASSDGLPSDRIRYLLEDRSGHLWVGTDQGLARAEIRSLDETGSTATPAYGQRFVAYTTRDGLSDNVIRSILEDREGNLWVGTNTGGVNRLKAQHVVAFGRPEGLPGDGVVPITEDADGTVWIGMTCGGLVRYARGAFTTYGKADGLPNDCVWSLLAGRDGHLWIGTWGGGLIRRDRSGHLTVYREGASGLVSDAVLALHEDRHGALWVGTGSGLNRLKDGAFTTYRRAEGLVADDVRFITEDRAGALWIGTTGGASRFASGAFTNYTTAQGLSADFVRAIIETDDGAVWFGTYGGGLNRLKDGRISQVTMRHGMFENIVSRILEDDLGNFWMTGNNGIVRVSRAELDEVADGRKAFLNAIPYGPGDGMRSSECNGGGQPAGWRTRDGRLWFPTARGVAVIDPRRIRLNEVVPPVAIEQVLVNREERSPGTEVVVPPGPAALEIRYTGLSFTAPEHVRFRYRLADLDEDWTDAGTRRTAYYSHLPPGRYTFSVMAANRDGVWNTAGVATQPLRVLPPFYRTWWSTALAAAMLAALLVVAHDRRVRRFKRERAEQDALSRRLIDSQETERKRIAAELHDSLSQALAVIRNRALVALSAPENQERAVEHLEEIAEATARAIDEVREISYNLRPYHLDRLGLTKAILVMIDRVAVAHHLRFTTDVDDLDGAFPADAAIGVYRIVQEAVSNAVKHADASAIHVAVKWSARAVTIAVYDNGRGFDAAEARGAAGFGLVGMAERVRQLGGSLSIESRPGAGTAVRAMLDTSHGHGDARPDPDRR
jgi:ligand-binding sensor domain-containing protein/signal transduction histidine kinase